MLFSSLFRSSVSIGLLACSVASLAMPTEAPLSQEQEIVCGPKSRNLDTQWFHPQLEAMIQALQSNVKRNGEEALEAHLPQLRPLVDYLLDDMKAHDHIPHVAALRQEVELHIAKNQYSATRFYSMHIRYAVLLSQPTTDEVEYHRFDENKSLFKNDSQGIPVVLNPAVELEDTFWPCASVYTGLPSEVNDALLKHLDPTILSFVRYPLLGEAELDISFMLNCWAKGVIPVAFPTEKQPNLHGMDFASPTGFALHDHIHGYEQDSKLKSALANYFEQKVEGVDPKLALRAAKQGMPILLEKLDLFQKTVGTYVSMLSKSHDAFPTPQSRNLALAGLFYMLHEEGGFSEDVFRGNSFTDALLPLKDTALEELDELRNWLDATDPLGTDPVTGVPSLNEATLKERVRESVIADGLLDFVPYEKREALSECSEEDQKNYLKEAEISFSLAKNRIKAILKWPDYEGRVLDFPTLYRNTRNSFSFTHLFEMAGIPVPQMPDFEAMESTPQRIEAAKPFVQAQKDGLIQLLNESWEVIASSLEGSELEQQYQQRSQDIEQRFLESF